MKKTIKTLIMSAILSLALSGCSTQGATGPQGPQGEQGIPGEPGPQGPAGNDGENGISIVSIALTSSSGNVDTYTITYSDGNTSTFTVTNGEDGQSIKGDKGDDGHTPVITIGANGNWLVDGVDTGFSAKGPKGDQGEQGPQGETGADGTSVLTGHGVPSTSTGKNGDSYIDLDTWDFYVKENGEWSKQGNIKGETGSQGEQGSQGSQGPQGEQGQQGNPGENGKTPYIGDNGNWWIGEEDTGVKASGSSTITMCGEPTSLIGNDGDSYIDLNNWNFYVKNNGDWNYVGNIKGSNGENGKSAYELYCEAHSEYAGTEEEWLEEIMSNRSITMSGRAGDNIVWKLYNDGKLEFDGYGQMHEFHNSSSFVVGGLNIPWQCFGPCTTEVSLKEGITSLCNYGLMSLSNVEHIYLPDSLEWIGWNAFTNCSSLKEITIPNVPNYLTNSSFQSCISLVSVDLPNTITEIGYAMFNGCSSLPSIVIPEGVTNIGWYAFNECSSLSSISLPDSLEVINSEAFEKCSSLQTLEIKKNVTTIASSAFKEAGLVSIDIPDNVTSLESFVFESCVHLTSVTLPSGLLNISSGLFDCCTSLPTIVIPNTVSSIGGSAFNDCSLLNNITIPKSVTLLDQYCFANCFSLTNLNYEGTVEEWEAITKNGGWRKGAPLTVVHCSDGDVDL